MEVVLGTLWFYNSTGMKIYFSWPFSGTLLKSKSHMTVFSLKNFSLYPHTIFSCCCDSLLEIYFWLLGFNVSWNQSINSNAVKFSFDQIKQDKGGSCQVFIILQLLTCVKNFKSVLQWSWWLEFLLIFLHLLSYQDKIASIMHSSILRGI